MLTHSTFIHRGLWDAQHPENSLGAFARAVAAGYGIECDVRMSVDGVPFVFHDTTAMRMTGCAGRVDAQTMAYLHTLDLQRTKYHIPSLQDVLQTVGGRVPLLLEIKPRYTHRAQFVSALVQVLARYDGPYSISSFDAFLACAIKRRMSQVAVGYHCSDYPENHPVIATAKRWGASVFLRASGFAPDFFVVRASYLARYGDPRRTHEKNQPLLTWGACNRTERRHIRQYGANEIREPIV